MIKRLLKPSISLLAALLLSPVQADSPAPIAIDGSISALNPYTASYSSTIKGIRAHLKRELKQSDERQWQLSNSASIFLGGVSEQSLFNADNTRLQTISYDYHNDFSSRRNSQLRFDWAANTVVDEALQDPAQTLPAEAWDKLSFQLQLRLDLQRLGSDFGEREYSIIDRDNTRQYQLKYLGEETVTTSAGSFQAVKLQKTRAGKDKHTVIWMAKNWQYLILKLERFKAGKSEHKLLLSEAHIAGRAVAPIASSSP